MKFHVVDLVSYLYDIQLYGQNNQLIWFQKNKGRDWLKGQNFGDYLSLVIVGEMLKKRNLKFTKKNQNTSKMIAIGSVLHLAKTGDVVWGSGLNGKVKVEKHTFTDLDVRAVRGPLSKHFLEERDIAVGNVFGDPALLLPILFPKLKATPEKGKIIVLPNLNERNEIQASVPGHMKLVSPMKYWKTVVKEILSSELVLTSSLHGLIVSEVFGVKARLVKPFGGETLLKYEDYYLGTGRVLKHPTQSFRDIIAEDMGTVSSEPIFNSTALMEAFPYNLFEQGYVRID